jgi:hypothetical protein
MARVLDPGWLGDVGARTMDELRAMRDECQELEVGASYVRRVLQGRLDLVEAVLAGHAAGHPVDASSLMEGLSAILADRTRAPGLGRLPRLMSPSDEEADTSEVDAVLPAGRLTTLVDEDPASVAAVADDLRAVEQQVSARRRALHERIDAIQGEMVRRYRTGEATVDTLLQ